jgi:hypothetical protein
MLIDAQMRLPRRQLLRSLVAGSLLMPGIVSQLLADDGLVTGNSDPLASKPPHFAAQAKNVIFLFMTGGVSHVDTFDPKPQLVADVGKEVKLDHPEIKNRPGYERIFLKRPQWEFAKHGECGTEVSSLFPQVAKCVDDLAVIRSMHTDHSNHYNATLGMHTGSFAFARPSLGSWVSYGLGTENQNLPSFVVLAPYLPYAGTQVWSSDFLPVCHQGTHLSSAKEPIQNLKRRTPSEAVQEAELDLLARFNRRHQHDRASDPLLAGRIKSFETAFGMQRVMPEVLDLSKESGATLDLYGLKPGSTDGFAWQCIVARRMAERGVRFIELIDSGSSNNWDSHGKMEDHIPKAKNVDRAIAGLLKDLKLRGMLEETLVVWTTEFGRTPHKDGATGRSHHPYVFSSWLAGGGVKGGITYGASDDYGYGVAEDPVHIHDFHATILHLLGLDHKRLTYRHAGRDFRLTDVHGNVVHKILA